MNFEISACLEDVLSCYHTSRARFELFSDEKVDGEGLSSSSGNPSSCSLLSALALLTCIAQPLLFRLFPIRTQRWTRLQLVVVNFVLLRKEGQNEKLKD